MALLAFIGGLLIGGTVCVLLLAFFSAAKETESKQDEHEEVRSDDKQED